MMINQGSMVEDGFAREVKEFQPGAFHIQKDHGKYGKACALAERVIQSVEIK